jgi:hypothetical protein
MSTKLETRAGTCPEHGQVDGERHLPRISFPFVITALIRLVAMRKPFRCPECGAPVA